VGLGALTVRARVVTDSMMTAAAQRLSEIVPQKLLEANCVYPYPRDLRDVCTEIAVAVATKAMEEDVAVNQIDGGKLVEAVKARMWYPIYARYRRSAKDK